MTIYLASIATSLCEIENRAYSNFSNSLEYIYNSLKSISSKEIDECAYDFFERDSVQNYFTEDSFKKLGKVNFRSTYGEFIIEKISDNKYQFVFYSKSSKKIDYFIVCELEMLELFD